ncbi:rCG25723 [Rattus norvegicus]|uniref:RCG25723 n=1 Tax=Rattus norvegicus TaxID=10116 RepID=A6I2X0_RAT|nr:rCG25723 [Rattus norvegicus]
MAMGSYDHMGASRNTSQRQRAILFSWVTVKIRVSPVWVHQGILFRTQNPEPGEKLNGFWDSLVISAASWVSSCPSGPLHSLETSHCGGH